MKYIFYVALTSALLFGYVANAQKKKTDAHITGHVIDAENNEHIPYAAITIKGTTVSSFADATGHFFIKNIQPGKYTVEVSFVGYKSTQEQVEVIPGKSVEVNFSLHPDVLQVGEVVVTGSRNESKRGESATIVNVAGEKLFEKTASNTVGEVLKFQPGLRVESTCNNCGLPQLRINGLGGQYSQILLDSRPIFSSLATVYGLEQLPAGMVERVEVIRGGGSALFGSSAIGGVVNIITKEPLRNSVTLSNNTGIYEGGGTDINTTLNASLVTDDYRTGVYIYGLLRDRDSYDRNRDGFSDLPKLNSEAIGLRGFHKISSNSRITAEFHHISEFRRGGNLFDHEPHEADIAEQLRHKINGGGLKYDLVSNDARHRLSLYSSLQSVKRQSYFGTNKSTKAYGRTEDMTVVAGGQYAYNFERLFFMPAQLTTGVEYTTTNLQDRMLGYNRKIDQFTSNYGFYAQNEWKNEKLGLLIGARVDKHNMVKNAIISPRANLRYTPSEIIAFRASYSSGYRAPQAYEEDLHVAAVGGEVSIITIDPNLRPEYSKSVSGSVDFYQRFGNVELNLLAEGFYTRLNDVFTLVEKGEDSQGNKIMERRNAPGATISGVNLEFRAGFTRKLILDAGYTIQRSLYVEPLKWSDDTNVPAHKKMFRSPDNYGFIALNYNPVTPLTLSLNTTYTGTMDVQHREGYIAEDRVVSTPDFWELGCRIAYKFRLSDQMGLELSGGMKNILNAYQKDLDVGVKKDASYVYGPNFPRMMFFGVKFTI